MDVEYDEAKRAETLQTRGLDMARAPEVRRGSCLDFVDERRDYGENRIISVGYLDSRMVILAWTPRGNVRRVISLRKANGREQRVYDPLLG